MHAVLVEAVMRRWLKGEPRLRDVLSDPVIQLMMRRDRVDPNHLHRFLRHISDTRVGSDCRGVSARLADLVQSTGDVSVY
jgi:hypothetical protein